MPLAMSGLVNCCRRIANSSARVFSSLLKEGLPWASSIFSMKSIFPVA